MLSPPAMSTHFRSPFPRLVASTCFFTGTAGSVVELVARGNVFVALQPNKSELAVFQRGEPTLQRIGYEAGALVLRWDGPEHPRGKELFPLVMQLRAGETSAGEPLSAVRVELPGPQGQRPLLDLGFEVVIAKNG